MAEPIVSRLPDTTKALTNKYRKNPGLIDPTSPVANALQALDIQRVGRGQQPMSAAQHELAARAAISGEPVTAPPDRGFFNDFSRNVRELTQSIPRLPMALYKEAQALPEAPQAISEALQGGGSIIERLAAAAQAPGVRLLPGAYIAGNLNNTGELWDNPLFTMLDILPAKNLPVVKNNTSKIAGQIKPKIAPITDPLAFSLKTSRPGMLVREAFGKQSRDVTEMAAVKNRQVTDQLHGTKPTQDVISNLARRTTTLFDEFPEIDATRRRELTQIMESNADEITSLPAREQALIGGIREITDQLGQYGASQSLLGIVDGEYYPIKVADKLLNSRRKATIANDFQAARTAAITPIDDIAPHLDSMRSILAREDLKPGAKTKLIEGYAHGIESAGIDARGIFAAIRDANKSKSLDNLAASIDNFVANPVTARGLDELIEVIKPHAAKDPMAAIILDHMRAGRWKQARGRAKRVASRKKYPIPGIDEVVERAEILSKKDRFIKSTSKFDEKKVAKLNAIAEQRTARAVPARFLPKIQEQVNAEVKVLLADDVNIPEVMQALRERNYGWLKANDFIDEVEFKRINNEVEAGWQALKESGYDPVFVHHAPESAIGALNNPRVLEHIPTPTSARTRINDLSGYIDDISIALPHQALEFLVRRGSDEFIDTMTHTWGKSRQEVLQDYMPAARVIAKSEGEVVKVAERLMGKEWTAYTSTNIINFAPARATQWATNNDILLPKVVANTVQRMHTPPGGRISAIMDPIMQVFRTSLLPLSPRWHMYNIMGGGIITSANSGLGVWKHMRDAWEMAGGTQRLKSGKWEYGADMPQTIPRGSATVPADMQKWNAKAGTGERIGAAFQTMGGTSMRKLWDQIQEAKTLGKVKDKFGKVVERSYDINGLFDDMYRSASYLYGKDKALTKGLSPLDAERAGVELARKTLQNIDRMTPIERSILRNVFPFYGWMSHIIRFSLKYPIDHPLRVAVMGSFARNEVEDMGDALPYRFLNIFSFGDMDEEGNTRGLNLAGLNPFSDVSSYFTLSGFMGQVNPLISSVLQSAGIDPGTGTPELFPTLRYDAETGRLGVKTTNPLMNFVNATIPQTRVLQGMFDSSSEFQMLLRSNPEAAKRLLVSQAGLPILFRDVNIPQEIGKAEIARSEDQSLVLNNAMKTGDYSEAERYPGLQPILAQLKSLQESGQLEQFKPTPEMIPGLSPGQSRIQQAQDALLGTLTPGG